MKPSLVKLTLIASCACMAVPAFSQSSAQPKTSSAGAAIVKPVPPASVATITAAGSVIILADGIVANAAVAQIQSPAPGFVYER